MWLIWARGIAPVSYTHLDVYKRQVMDLRSGNLCEFDGVLYRVSDFQHVKPGKGGGFVRLKLKNVELGTVTDKTLDSWEKVPEPPVEEKEMQYLYKQGEKFIFLQPAARELFPSYPVSYRRCV